MTTTTERVPVTILNRFLGAEKVLREIHVEATVDVQAFQWCGGLLVSGGRDTWAGILQASPADDARPANGTVAREGVVSASSATQGTDS